MEIPTRSVPWWGLGNHPTAYEVNPDNRLITVEEAKNAISWTVELHPTYQRLNSGYYAPVPGSHQLTMVHPGAEDNEKVLGIVGNLYPPDTQPSDVIDFGIALVEQEGWTFDTIGELRGHEIVFAVLNTHQTTGRGETWYLVISSAFTGQQAFRCDIVPINFMNHTVQKDGVLSSFAIKHIGDWDGKLTAAQKFVGQVRLYQESYRIQMEAALDTPLSAEEFDKQIVDHFLPPKLLTQTKGREFYGLYRKELLANFLHSPTIYEGARMTVYGALQTTLEWAEWIYDGRKDRRTAPIERHMLGTLFGGKQEIWRKQAYKTWMG